MVLSLSYLEIAHETTASWSGHRDSKKQRSASFW